VVLVRGLVEQAVGHVLQHLPVLLHLNLIYHYCMWL
jgi:hypothetical protein